MSELHEYAEVVRRVTGSTPAIKEQPADEQVEAPKEQTRERVQKGMGDILVLKGGNGFGSREGSKLNIPKFGN